jgi:NAD(P)H-hydrate epimerase
MKITGLAIGPGLWRERKTKASVVDIIEGFEVPMVVDADAVRALSEVKHLDQILKDKKIVLTPHSDEFFDLTGTKVSTDVKERIDAVKNFAAKLNCTIILKGHYDVISDGKQVAINKTGNVFMSKGGFGDSLTGICAAFLSRRINQVDEFTAACAAAYINGRAGDIAAKNSHEGLLVTEMVEKIPEVIKHG